MGAKTDIWVGVAFEVANDDLWDEDDSPLSRSSLERIAYEDDQVYVIDGLTLTTIGGTMGYLYGFGVELKVGFLEDDCKEVVLNLPELSERAQTLIPKVEAAFKELKI